MQNPLDVLNYRALKVLPRHFQKITYDDRNTNKVSDWVADQLDGRYYIGKYPSYTASGIRLASIVAFEDQTDLTFFIMACPFINFSTN